MATIFDFKPASAAGGALAAVRTSGTRVGPRVHTAEVIFFPGVRYERHEPQREEPPRRKRRRTHELLELPD